MERIEHSRKRKFAVRSAVAALLLNAACVSPNTTATRPEASPVPVEAEIFLDIDTPIVLSDGPLDLVSMQRALGHSDRIALAVPSEPTEVDSEAGSIDAPATAGAPAVRIPGPEEIVMPDPEVIKQELQSKSVKLLKCSGAIIGTRVETSAHCFKELYGGGTTLSGSGTPVYDATGAKVGTITDLIVNHAADIAIGALDGSSAEEAFASYMSTVPSLQTIAESVGGAVLYTAGFPAGQPLQTYRMTNPELRNARILYADGERQVPVITATHEPGGGPSCTPGTSGSPGELVTAIGKEIPTGPFVAFSELGDGRTQCSFALPSALDPANNVKISYLG